MTGMKLLHIAFAAFAAGIASWVLGLLIALYSDPANGLVASNCWYASSGLFSALAAILFVVAMVRNRRNLQPATQVDRP